MPVWRKISATSRPRAGHSWNGSRARSCPACLRSSAQPYGGELAEAVAGLDAQIYVRADRRGAQDFLIRGQRHPEIRIDLRVPAKCDQQDLLRMVVRDMRNRA